jgi:hypothetical protein
LFRETRLGIPSDLSAGFMAAVDGAGFQVAGILDIGRTETPRVMYLDLVFYSSEKQKWHARIGFSEWRFDPRC